jgi:N-acetylglucosaminyldiphosphoundecaprenol N-acetyl-beta-D-mannosaminyltransferase
MRKTEYRGVTIITGGRSELISYIEGFIGVGGTVFTPNCLMMAEAVSDSDFRKVLAESDINIPDGVGISLLLSLGGNKTDRLAGVELGKDLLVGRSFAIIGGIDGRAELAAQKLLDECEGARACFTVSGYGIDEEKITAALGRTQPDVCIVCLGSPKQEYFVNKIRQASPRTLYLALGGAVDVYSGKIRRAPRLFRALGLEWLWRVLIEPRRVSRLPRLFGFFTCEFFNVLNKKRGKAE